MTRRLVWFKAVYGKKVTSRLDKLKFDADLDLSEGSTVYVERGDQKLQKLA